MPLHPLDFLNALWLTALFWTLGAAPGTLIVRRLELPPWLWAPLVLASASLVAYAFVWLYFFWPMEARRVSTVVTMGSACAFLLLLASGEIRAYLRQRDVWLPLALLGLLLVADLSYVAWAGVEPTYRFTMPLPPEDNRFPLMLADRWFNGMYTTQRPQPLTTLILEARGGDRPPLQTGVVLAVRAMGLGSGSVIVSAWSYEVLTAACQLGWVLSFYALARVLALGRRQVQFVMTGAACSGFFLVHSVYTWPKLYAASLFLTALALGIHLIRNPAAISRGAAVVMGALAGLSLLAHGGPAFSVAALPVLLLSGHVRRALRVRDLVLAAGVAALLLSPWMAYQHYYDPPGNRLAKLHLAGVWEDSPRSTLAAMRESYGRLTVTEYVRGRWRNVEEQGFVLNKSGRTHPADWMQWQQFYHHGPALGFLLVGLAAFLVRRSLRAEAAAAFGLPQVTWYALAAYAVWIVLVFDAGTAYIHHGSYATTALLFFCGAAWLASLPAWIRRAAFGLHVALFAGAWLVMRALHDAAPASPAPRWNWPAAALMALSFAAFVLALRAVPEEGRPDVRAPATRAA